MPSSETFDTMQPTAKLLRPEMLENSASTHGLFRSIPSDDVMSILNILDAAEDILDAREIDQEIASIEPIPLGPAGIGRIVRAVSLCDSGLLSRQSVDREELLNVLGPSQSTKATHAVPEAPSEDIFDLEKDEACTKVTLSAFAADVQPIHCIPPPSEPRFLKYQADQWDLRFQDFVEFRKKHGHCLVPHDYPENPKLAQWIKRQRYQYKLKKSGCHSTLSEKRQTLLEEMGFVWHSHNAIWLERFESLKAFKALHGHCMVPANYPDRPLAIWVKCQRRRRRVHVTRRSTNSKLALERFALLEGLGFNWNPRNL